VEQLFEVFVIDLQTAHCHAVVVGQDEEGTRGPAIRDGNAQLAPSIVAEQLHAFKAHIGSIARLVFNPEGTQLATAGADQTVKLWDVSGSFRAKKA